MDRVMIQATLIDVPTDELAKKVARIHRLRDLGRRRED